MQNPHLSFKTSKATATAAGNSASSSVPWMNRKLEVVKQFQADIQSEIDGRRSQLYRAQNEQGQAEAMLARTIQSSMDRRENWADQLSQRRSFLLASRAEEKAMATREKAFKKQLAELAKTIEEEEQNKKRGGKAVLAGVKGNNARGFLAMMDRQTLRTREAEVDHALRRLQAIIPDITPDGLVEGFMSRRERVAAVREESARAQAKHDELAATREALGDQLEAVKGEVLHVDAKEGDPLGGRAGRPEDVADSKVFRAENGVRMDATHARGSREGAHEERRCCPQSREHRAKLRAVADVHSHGRGDMAARGGAEARQADGETVRDGEGGDASIWVVEIRADGDGEIPEQGQRGERRLLQRARRPRRRRTPEWAGNTPTSVGGDRSVAATSAELMNREAREGIVALTAFFDKLDRANVIAAADVHKQLVEEAARKQGCTRPKSSCPRSSSNTRGETRGVLRPGASRATRAATTAEEDAASSDGEEPRSTGSLVAGGSSKSVVFDENVPPDAPQRSDSPKPKLSRGPARIVRRFPRTISRVLKPETEESSDDEGGEGGGGAGGTRGARQTQGGERRRVSEETTQAQRGRMGAGDGATDGGSRASRQRGVRLGGEANRGVDERR